MNPPGFPGGTAVKNTQEMWFSPWVRNIAWRRAWQPTVVYLPGESHGQRGLVVYSSGGAKSWTRLNTPFLKVVMGNKISTDFSFGQLGRDLYLFIMGDWNAKVGSQETPGVTGKFGFEVQNEAGQRLIEFCQENALVIANTIYQ